ncbi:MAG: RodZ domain-containing protein [Pikeienuella sp.]
MGNEYNPELRGFDSYELKLGDEMRGERASLGKSLLDVQRDLRIRADYIAAIENADASAFPFTGFAAGYVRSYARYLDMDEDDVYRRFCRESGFVGVDASRSLKPEARKAAAEAAPARSAGAGAGAADRAVISTRFMKANVAAARGELNVSLRGLASLGVLVGLVGALVYGGWALLQDLQRLGFAPLPTAPEVLVSAPDILAPADSAAESPAADASPPDEARVTLASIYAAQEAAAPAISPRDGPISSIDPKRAGIYAAPAAPSRPETGSAPYESAAIPPGQDVLADAAPQVPTEGGGAPALVDRGVDIFATEDAWVRVRDGERKVLFTGILGPGERFILPEGVAAPQLRAGNAGAVYILIDGVAYGPLGDGPEVAKNVDLKPDAVRAAYAPAADFIAPPRLTEAVRETEMEQGGAVALQGE